MHMPTKESVKVPADKKEQLKFFKAEKVIVSDILETIATEEEKSEGYDIADYYLKIWMKVFLHHYCTNLYEPQESTILFSVGNNKQIGFF